MQDEPQFAVPGGEEPGTLVTETESLIARAEARLDAVEAAIAALENGTYGHCEVCGEAIEPDRLAARATENRCGTHADSRPASPRLF